MKVTIEVQSALANAPSGVPQYTIQLTRALLKRGNNDYSLSFFDYNRERNNKSYADHYFGDLSPRLLECNGIHYGMLIDERAYSDKSYNDYTGSYADVFHFPRLDQLPTNIKGKMVVTYHDTFPVLPFYGALPYYSGNTLAKFALTLKYVQRMMPLIITVSFSAKEDIIKYADLPEDDIHVVHHGINHEILFPEKNGTVLAQFGIKEPYFMALSSINYARKNMYRIVDAFERIAEKKRDIQLVLAGACKEKKFIEFVEGSKFRNRIIRTGFVTDEQRRALLSDALAMVYPSLYEGFGLPIIEAMACGAPVITSNVSSMPEAAGDAGILIDPNDTEQLAFEMQRVLDSSELRAELSKRGLAHSAKFTWEKAAEETERVYQLAFDS